MPYSTIPITSGAAKFSTLDPDAALFLEENNITVGANPENPATLYDYSTSTLTIGNIQTTNGELNIHNADLIGVKRFICEDYLGAILTTVSDTEQKVLTLNDIANAITKKFRIPSNFVAGSSIRVKYYAKNMHSSTIWTYLYQYFPDTQTTVEIDKIVAPANSETELYLDIPSCNPGEYYCLMGGYPTCTILGESKGVKLCYDIMPYSDSIWDVIN